jgi:site-specific recombinase XerD
MPEDRRDRRDPGAMSPSRAAEMYLQRRRQDSTEESVQTFHYRIKQFVEFCEDTGIDRVDELQPFDLDDFYAEQAARLADNTLKGRMHSVRGFLRWLADARGAIDDSLPEAVQIPTVDPSDRSDDTMLQPDDALALLDWMQSHELGSRRHVLLELLFTTGARVSGVRTLDVQDVHLDDAYVEFAHRPQTGTPLKKKLGGQRPVALPERSVRVLWEWLANRPDVNDDVGRAPLIPSSQGRPTVGTLRAWTYQATIPCLHSECPHEKDPETCDWTSYNSASKCPSSRSPHQVRTGSITHQRDLGFPAEVVAERCNASLDVIEEHYDKATAREEMERRRRQFVDRFDTSANDDQ